MEVSRGKTLSETCLQRYVSKLLLYSRLMGYSGEQAGHWFCQLSETEGKGVTRELRPLNKVSDLNKENNERQETLDRKKVLESMNLRIQVNRLP